MQGHLVVKHGTNNQTRQMKLNRQSSLKNSSFENNKLKIINVNRYLKKMFYELGRIYQWCSFKEYFFFIYHCNLSVYVTNNKRYKVKLRLFKLFALVVKILIKIPNCVCCWCFLFCFFCCTLSVIGAY